jgi:hypothetical protein
MRADPSRLSVRMDWGLLYVFEIAAEAVPAEWAGCLKRPGVVELLVNVVRLVAGGSRRSLTPAWEVDMALRVPTSQDEEAVKPPRTGARVLKVMSDDPEYLAICRTGSYPLCHARGPLRVDRSAGSLTARVSDDLGPVVTFGFDGGHGFDPVRRNGQEVVETEDGVHRFNYCLEGKASLWRGSDGNAKLHSHPFFEPLNLAAARPKCCEQLALRPGVDCTIDYRVPEGLRW